jgi:hypothetical protein
MVKRNINYKGKEKEVCLLLGILEEKFYYRYMDEHSQRQGPIGKSKVCVLDQIVLGHMGIRGVEGRGKRGEKVQQPRVQSVKESHESK